MGVGISSRNILLSSNNTVKICDFGVAVKIKSDKIAPNMIIGSPQWMSPEQVSEPEACGFGCLAAMVLTIALKIKSDCTCRHTLQHFHSYSAANFIIFFYVQINGGQLSLKSDVFSLGTLMWEFICHKWPFKVEDDLLDIRAAINKPAPKLDLLGFYTRAHTHIHTHTHTHTHTNNHKQYTLSLNLL
jgi:serine/threonine protein kinase